MVASSPSLPLSSPLPPSERDFDIYQAVVVEGQSTRQAAGAAGVSQTRIVQIATRVAEWIGREVPPTRKLTPAQRLNVAADLAGRRMDHLYGVAMRAFQKSQGEHVTHRSSLTGDVTTTTQSQGDFRYLWQAMRIAERAGKRSWQDRPRAATTDEPTPAAFGPMPGDGLQADDWVLAPSKEDCSEPGDWEPRATGSEHEPVVPTPAGTTTSDDVQRRRKEFLDALNHDTSPVQPPVTDRNGMLVEAEPDHAPPSHPQSLSHERRGEEGEGAMLLPLAAGAESLSSVCLAGSSTRQAGSGTHRPLNRKERRARQRKLEKVMARKAK